MKILTEDLYSFLGHTIGVSSNSKEILAHLRLVYGRFYQVDEDTSSSNKKKKANARRHRIEIIDNIASSNEIIIKDKFKSYRLTCKNLNFLENKELDFDPLGSIQWFVLWTASILAKKYFLIHAGAVASKTGGMIFPATSGMGKTTLTIKLVQKGFNFLSDEVACLNPERNIIEPFYRKLSLTEESRHLLGLPSFSRKIVRLRGQEGIKWLLDIEDIVSSSLSGPCTPRYIIFLRGFGEKPRLEYVSCSNALFNLLHYPISPIDNPGFFLFKYASFINKMRCFNLVIGDMDQTAELVMRLADQGKQQNG